MVQSSSWDWYQKRIKASSKEVDLAASGCAAEPLGIGIDTLRCWVAGAEVVLEVAKISSKVDCTGEATVCGAGAGT